MTSTASNPSKENRELENLRRDMFMKCFTQTLLTLLLLLEVSGSRSTAQAQSEIPADPSATFKTLIPHLNAIPRPSLVQGAEAPEQGESFLPSFSGSPYTVGASVFPTTTVPEAEEHIAVDPSNFNNLV